MLGLKVGMLTVVARAPTDAHRRACWRCRCDCGSEVVRTGNYLRTEGTRTQSCGCVHYAIVSASTRKYNTLEDYLKNTKAKRGCREWKGSLTPQGYAFVGHYKPKTQTQRPALVHRRVFELVHGFLPPVVMHTCDNPRCINPAHLLAGTKKLNSQDAVTKGRWHSAKNALRVSYKRKKVTMKELSIASGVPLSTLYWRKYNAKKLVK